MWARGYFCATGGSVTEETIERYIECQALSDKEDIFKRSICKEFESLLMEVFNLKKEIRLILLAVLKKRSKLEEEELDTLIKSKQDWGFIAGQLLNHRLSGYFYEGLNSEQRYYMLPEFRRTINLLLKGQRKLAIETVNTLQPILNEFDNQGIRYAALKGLVFHANIYKIGERRSNDCDILVLEEDLEKLDKVLRKFGFIQALGNSNTEATRKEKIIQRLNYHDLVPYVKEFNLDFLEKLRVDINFHFDSKDHDITKQIIDYGTTIYSNDKYKIKGLKWETHLAHLCVHFHREGSNNIWVDDKRDVTLYKIVDIINTLRLHSSKEQLYNWLKLMKDFGLEQQCYFTLYHLMEFYPNEISEDIVDLIRPSEVSFVNEVKINNNIIKTREVSFFDQTFNLVFSKDFRKQKQD